MSVIIFIRPHRVLRVCNYVSFDYLDRWAEAGADRLVIVRITSEEVDRVVRHAAAEEHADNQ